MIKVQFVNIFDFSDLTFNSMPLGILSLATVLKNNKNISAEVVDFHRLYEEEKILYSKTNLDENIERCCKYLIEREPQVISFYTMANTHAFAIMMARKIKNKYPSIKILLGGPQASLTAKNTLNAFKCIDAIGVGDGEETIEKILLGIVNNDFSEAEGICYRLEDQIIYKSHPLIENLDVLPLIDISLLNCVSIGDRISIDAGRGCPFGCSFCSAKMMWERSFRIKSANRLYQEILYYYHEYGITNYGLEHDIFVLDKKNVYAFCNLLLQSGLDIEWGCSARLDSVDEDMLKIMSKAGCRRIYFGIETGSTRMQKKISKNLNLSKLDTICDWLQEYGIIPRFSFIYGFPEESYEDVDATLNMIYHIYEKWRNVFSSCKGLFQLHKLIFYPGTEELQKVSNRLEYVENTHYDASRSIDHWNNEELKDIVSNVDIFSNYFEFKSELRSKLKNLDYFFNIIFYNAIIYYDVTYKLLLEKSGNSNLNLYYKFLDSIDEIMYSPFSYCESFEIFFKAVTDLLHKVVIKANSKSIKAIFEFEKDMFYFNIDNINVEDRRQIKKYECDVLKMKKMRLNLEDSSEVKLLFEKCNNKAKVTYYNK